MSNRDRYILSLLPKGSKARIRWGTHDEPGTGESKSVGSQLLGFKW